jgi:hypothetical protein
MAKQLTKRELQNLEIGSIVTEKLFNETYHLKVEKIESEKILTYHMVDINSKKRGKLVVAENFNKEGDRKYKSSNGSVIVKYYEYVESAD